MKQIDDKYFINKNDKNEKFDINKVLNKNEKVLWKGRPKRISYILQAVGPLTPVALVWAIIDISILVFMIPNLVKDAPVYGVVLIIVFFLFHLMPVWMWISGIVKSAIESKTTKYYITNKRILEVKGTEESAYIKTELDLKVIESCQIKKSTYDKIFKVSDIYVKSQESAIVLFDIFDGEFICQKLLNLKDEVENNDEFYKENIICEHCDSMYSSKLKKCPNCGASSKNK